MLVTGELTATCSVCPDAGSTDIVNAAQSAIRTQHCMVFAPGRFGGGYSGRHGSRPEAIDDRASHPHSLGVTSTGMNILSIQSWVVYGHVGNASAVFPLQRLGAEVWSINTVQFSNHTGYGHWTGQVYTGNAVRELVDGIAACDVLRRCDAVLSGYMGDAGIGSGILHA